jgi:hypothetical protein
VGHFSLRTGIVYIQILYCSIHACICTYVICIHIYVRMYRHMFIYVFLYSSCTQRTSVRANEQTTAHDCAVLITLLLQLLLRLSAALLAQISLSSDACLVQQLLPKTSERFCEFWRENWFLKNIYLHIFLGGLSWVGLASGTCRSSCLQINQTLGKRSSRGGVKIPGFFFFWVDCNVRGS